MNLIKDFEKKSIQRELKKEMIKHWYHMKHREYQDTLTRKQPYKQKDLLDRTTRQSILVCGLLFKSLLHSS